ncbi:hypothetical protein RB653_004648 [Dictyostelium firmibasis]|uniref:Alpha-mannosidase n=1 Tax=Dictyostelium firmibasis TaxID=79012 RepID=A0AAN7U6D5_9MYCE
MNKTKFLKIVFFLGIWILLSTIIVNIYNNHSEILDQDGSTSFKKIFQLNGESNDEKLSVFLIPHSHCDSGWLKDYDEYYYNVVRYILSGIIDQLTLDIENKFNWVEIGFFSRWWEEQNESKREIVRGLIKNKQFVFISGGWVQNDEATASVDDVITQMTQGHQWLRDTLNVTIEYAWQIDPFGYSSSTPTIFSNMGIKGLVINRVSNDVKSYMKSVKEMEFIWKGSESLGEHSQMLVSTLNVHYDYPKHIDPKKDFTLDERVKGFAQYLKDLAKTRESNILMIPLGDDFRYTNAKSEFAASKEWLKVLQDNKEHYNIEEIKYATIDEYFIALEDSFLNKLGKSKKENIYNDISSTLSLYNKDFFPYSTGTLEYWTGYYSTRPLLKRLIRESSHLQKLSDILYTLAIGENSNNPIDINSLQKLSKDLNENRNTISLVQHHDIVTGTSRSYVLQDNFERLQKSRISNYNIISNSLEFLLNKNNSSTAISNININNSSGDSDSNSNGSNSNGSNSNGSKNSNELSETNQPFTFENVIDLSDQSYDQHSLVFHNTLGWEVKQHISFRLKVNKTQNKLLESLQLVEAFSSKVIQIQIIPIQDDLKCQSINNNYIVFAIINLPPLGLNTYYLRVNDKNSKVYTFLSKPKTVEDGEDVKFSNNRFNVEFKSNGLINKVTDKNSNQIKSIEQSFNQYTTKKSGPYIFNVKGGKKQNFLKSPEKLVYYDGPLVSQLVMLHDIEDDCNVTSIVVQRIYKNNEDDNKSLITENFIETGYSIIGDMNRETTINYKVKDLENDGIFYTDNGLESRKRIYDDDRTVNQNYYPVLNYIKLKEISSSENTNNQYTVYVDRSVGATSPSDGEMEIMVHRTMDTDDWKGVGWPSKDIGRSDGKLYFNLDSVKNQSQNEKRISLHITNQPIMFVKKQQVQNVSNKNYLFKYSPLSNQLPSNIHLQSLLTLNNKKVGLRLFNIHEIDSNSQTTTTETEKSSLFNEMDTSNFIETGLSFLELIQNNLIDKFSTRVNKEFPIKCGESEYSFINSQPSSIILSNVTYEDSIENKNIVGDTIQIKPHEIKSFTFDFVLKLNEETEPKVYKNNDKFVDQSIENDRYEYDFSFFPIRPSFYNDRGRYNRPSKLALILSLSIGIPAGILIIIVSSIIIYKKRKNRKNKFLPVYSNLS